jgi:hypothetical protein
MEARLTQAPSMRGLVDMADSHQFGAYTDCFGIGPVCLCAHQGTDLSEDSGTVPPANQNRTKMAPFSRLEAYD